MALDNAWNVYIFRDGRATISGCKLAEALVDQLLSFSASDLQTVRTELLELLLRAAELECALADAQSPQAGLAATVTDDVAAALVLNLPLRGADLARRISTINPPEYVSVTPPEGFAYYALHPLDYVDLLKRVEGHSRYVGVVGIRSVGTTISAVVQAALRGEGIHAERITVRPYGHPYDRKTILNDLQLRWLSGMRSHQAEFLVVDEGPGMSGSSFLSVGDALLSAGLGRSEMAFLGSREPNADSLTAPNAASRWKSFRSYYTHPTRYLPKKAQIYVAGGIWRADVFASEEQWPASWLQMERLKFVSRDRRLLFKFEGIGRFGTATFQRALQVYHGGFGPKPLDRDEGFGVYQILPGRPLSTANANSTVLKSLAEYCAFRSRAFQVPLHDTPDLQTMVRFNASQEFGSNLLDEIGELRIERPVVADGRMLPHKWIDSEGALLKVDASSHGDDHFFPGPTDIAWDLAGTIVEWDLDFSRARYFLDCYGRMSGDETDERLPAYLLAYSVFRMSYCKMAAAASHGTPEAARLVRDYLRYRGQALHYVEQASKGELRRALSAAVAKLPEGNASSSAA